jgi:hypothetical protein
MAGRLLGWLLIASALVAAGGDLVRSLERGRLALLTAGDAVATFWPHAADGLRGWHPALRTGADWALRQPVASVVLVLGLVLLVLFRRRERRRGRPSFNRID